LRLERQDDAGVYEPAVEDHVAGAAVAIVAALLGPGEPQLVAEDLQEALPRLTEKIHVATIDSRANCNPSGHNNLLP
jgi:hypothetical protein